jgi:curved DNA-binding protein CbpA
MQTHPDVASDATTNNTTQLTNADKFKRISEAYAILGNQKARRRYDYEISNDGIRELRRAAARGTNPHAAGGGSGSFAAALPRNLLIGGMLGVVGVTLLKTMLPSKDEDDASDHMARTGQRKLVEAWKNPTTGRWEKPKPWDPTYQKLQPVLQLVPRDKVHNDDNR